MGRKKVTSSDVAAASGVSQATVSMILNRRENVSFSRETVEKVEAAAKELGEKEITATAGGGAVEVTVSGKKEIKKVKLSEEVVDPDDIEMLEDLIVAATNEALRQVEEYSQQSMSKITGGLGGGFPF